MRSVGSREIKWEQMSRRDKLRQNIDYYLSLPYTLEVIPDDEEGGWVIKIKELSGCMTQADQWDEILPMIEEAKRLWLEVALEYGHMIPEPAGITASE